MTVAQVTGPAQITTFDQMSQGGSSIAKRLLANNLKLSSLRTNATLSYDEWKVLDDAAVQAYVDQLVAVDDLISRGLTHPLGSIGTMVTMYNTVSEMSAANVSMWANADFQGARALLNLVQIPVPVIYKDYGLDIRELDASRRTGNALDVTHAAAAGRVVGETFEDILFNGNTTAMGDLPIYGYRTHPNRNTTAGSSWGTATNIMPNIRTMISGLVADNATGPYVLYLHSDQYYETTATTANDLSYRQLALDTFPELEDIKLAKRMTAGEAVMVSMNRETVDVARVDNFGPVEWEGMGGLSLSFRNMIVGVPRVKADYHGRSGVYHMTGI